MIIMSFLILALSYVNLEEYYNMVDKYQWRETISYIEDNASIGDYVAVYPIFEIESARYYKDRDDLHYYSLNDELISITDIGNKNLWLVLADHARTKRKAIEDAMLQRYDLVDQKKYKLLNLYKYQKKKVQ
ncbi:MAG: hypothetical protein DHS20C13_17450 [Thermodesulfobacteriota bacterium]|nr:MAG: hypothetical protein DHS20C13_17450 [Thermodesulfobacteriota bacterium]